MVPRRLVDLCLQRERMDNTRKGPGRCAGSARVVAERVALQAVERDRYMDRRPAKGMQAMAVAVGQESRRKRPLAACSRANGDGVAVFLDDDDVEPLTGTFPVRKSGDSH